MHRTRGYTLLEVSIVLLLTGILIVAMGGVLVRSMRAADNNDDRTTLNASLRSAEMSMYVELAQATLGGMPLDVPAVAPLALPNNPGDTITFRRPLAVDGSLWSGSITYRLRNEDTNANLLPDIAEDADESGIIDRVIERLEDLDGDGTFDGPGETRVIARDIDNLQFALNGTQLTTTITGRRRVGEFGDISLTETISFVVNLTN